MTNPATLRIANWITEWVGRSATKARRVEAALKPQAALERQLGPGSKKGWMDCDTIGDYGAVR